MEFTASDLQLIEEFTFNTEENVKQAMKSLRVSEWLDAMDVANIHPAVGLLANYSYMHVCTASYICYLRIFF